MSETRHVGTVLFIIYLFSVITALWQWQ